MGQSKPEVVSPVANVDEHNAAYLAGTSRIKPHIFLDNKVPAKTKQTTHDIQKGIACLNAVVNYNPANWNALWIIGKGYQALGDDLKAYSNFKCAYELEKGNPNVAREYGQSCLRLGHGAEVVSLCIAAMEAAPNDAGLHANLALAYLISGEISFAKRAILYALQMKPDDKVSLSVQRLINDVADGKRAQPKSLAELRAN